MIQIEITRTALLTPRNLKALLAALRLQPGSHPAGDLYEGYLELCQGSNAAPISKKAFGLSLANQGCGALTLRIDGVRRRCWQIPRSRFPSAAEARPEFSPESRHPTIAHPEGT